MSCDNCGLQNKTESEYSEQLFLDYKLCGACVKELYEKLIEIQNRYLRIKTVENKDEQKAEVI
jgi:hypothetical protein